MPNNDPHWQTRETFRSLSNLAVAGLKAMLLINGGAVVATLAYLGQLEWDEFTPEPPYWVLLPFAVGVFFAGLAFHFAYFTQLALLTT